MSWDYLWINILAEIPAALPWLVGIFGSVSILSFGPVGRALAQRLKHGTEDAERSAAVIEEVHSELAEVLERLDAQERLLTGRRGAQITPMFPAPEDTEETADTPT